MIPPLPRFNRQIAGSRAVVLGRPTLETPTPAARHLWFAEKEALCLVWQHGPMSRTVRRVAWNDVLAFSELEFRRVHRAQRFGLGLQSASLLVAQQAGTRVQVLPLDLCSQERQDLVRARRFFERAHPANVTV